MKPDPQTRRAFLVCWLPLGVALPLALAAGRWLPPWVWMWTLSVAIYGGFKWYTLARAWLDGTRPRSRARVGFYFLGWPGMDARGFLAGPPPPAPSARGWVGPALKTALGAALLWGVARGAGGGLLTGWIGMTGIIFLLHFGSFDVLAWFWRRRGIDAAPLMRAPILAASLGEFWGRRWNSAFRDLVFGAGFAPLKRRFRVRVGTLLIFGFSGLVHDLVISLPAGGGYGLPTAYFTLQGAGLLAEHARGSALAGWRGRWQGRVWTWLIVAGPAFWLFHPSFVRRVILPLMHAIHAL